MLKYSNYHSSYAHIVKSLYTQHYELFYVQGFHLQVARPANNKCSPPSPVPMTI